MNEQRIQKIRKTMGIILLTLICLAVLLCIGFTIYMYIQKQEYKNRPKPTYSTEVIIDKGVLEEWTAEIVVCLPTSGAFFHVCDSKWVLGMSNGVISFVEYEDSGFYDEDSIGFYGGNDAPNYVAGEVLTENKELAHLKMPGYADYSIQIDGYVYAFAHTGNQYYGEDNEYAGNCILMYVYEEDSEDIVYAQSIFLEDYCLRPRGERLRVGVNVSE